MLIKEVIFLNYLPSLREARLVGLDDPEACRQVNCILYLRENLKGAGL